MATGTEGAQTTTTEGSSSTVAPGGTPAGGAGAKVTETPKVEAKVTETPKVEAKEPKTEVEKSAAKSLDDEEEHDPKSPTPYALTGAQLTKRINRGVKSAMRTHFGVDDPEVVKAKLTKLNDFEAQAEKDRVAKLATEDRLKEEAAKERKRADELEAQLTKQKESQIIQREETRLQKMAGEFIDGEYIDEVALPKFAIHLRKNMTQAEINAMTDEDIRGWFKAYAEKHPKLSKDQPKEERPKVGLTSGARTEKPKEHRSGGAETEKTAAPNRPNSMTKKEINDAGFKW